MNRTTTRTSGDRIGMSIIRSMIDTVSDGHLLQSLKLFGRGTESFSDVEHMHPFGMRTYPKGKTSDEDAKNGMPKGGPEISLLASMGNQSHQMAMPAIDRRFGPKGLKEGETVFHDAAKQFLHFAQGLMKGESPMKIVHQVASAKQKQQQQQSQSAGDQQKQQQDSMRADLAGDKDVHVAVTMSKDGTYDLNAQGAATLKAKSFKFMVGKTEWHLTEDGFQQKGGKFVKHDDRNIGKGHKHDGVQSGASQTGEPVAG